MMTESAKPIPMLLWCPECRRRHIDVGEFATKAHHTHACQYCGHVWRPALVPTCGVQFLPGFKNPGEVCGDVTDLAESVSTLLLDYTHDAVLAAIAADARRLLDDPDVSDSADALGLRRVIETLAKVTTDKKKGERR